MAEKTVSNCNDKKISVRYDESKRNFRKAVKTRLNNEFINSRLKQSAVLDKLKELGYNTNKGTLKKTLDPLDESSFDLWIIKGLCECFSISLGELLEDPMFQSLPVVKTPDSVVVTPDDISVRNELRQKFEKYKGTYFCYSNSRNDGKDDIVEFKLEIEDRDGIKAILTYYGNINIRKKDFEALKTYTCVPRILGKECVVLLEFADNDYTFYHFYFKVPNFYTSSLYHRRGFYVTTSTKQGHELAPLLNGFVLFDKQLSLSDINRYVPTLLSLNTSKFTISENVYNHIMQDKSELSSFLTDYSKNIEKNGDSYIIHENQILVQLAEIEPKRKQAHLFDIFTQIKSYANNCTQAVFPDERPYARFAYYNLLEKEKTDENESTQ